MNADTTHRIAKWLLFGNIRPSANFMLGTALAAEDPELREAVKMNHRGAFVPYDSHEFSACLALVREIPEVKEKAFPLLRTIPAWTPYVMKWDEIVETHDRIRNEMKGQPEWRIRSAFFASYRDLVNVNRNPKAAY